MKFMKYNMQTLNKQTLRNKVYAHKYAHNNEDTEWCNSIIAELEAENYHTLVKLLIDCEWQTAYEWIEKNF